MRAIRKDGEILALMGDEGEWSIVTQGVSVSSVETTECDKKGQYNYCPICGREL